MNTTGTVGIDLGSQTALIGISKKGVIEIINNEASQRENPVVVGFGQTERLVGEQGYAQLKSNFKNTVFFPIRFLGLTGDSPNLEREKRWLYCPIITNPDNGIAFEVNYKGEKKQFLPEQIIAMVLQKLKQIRNNNGVYDNDMVITVPSYSTDQERRALLAAAKIADINVLKLLNESSAVALAYGASRRSELDDKPRNVCFVDIGHSSTSAFVVACTKSELKVLNQQHERNLGTRDFDWKMLEFYCEKLEKQYGINVISKEKSRLRLLDAIEKQRKILSANTEASINVEYVAEDYDLNEHLNRDEYEKINQVNLNNFRLLLTRLKSELQFKLHSVEILGGGSRMPSLQKVIQEVFGLECSRTLHSTESIARGAAIQAMILNKNAVFTLEEANYLPVECAVEYINQKQNMAIEGNKDQTCVLFEKGCSIPAMKSIEVTRADSNISLGLYYPGRKQLLQDVLIYTQQNKEQDFRITIKINLNLNGILEYQSAELIEEFLDETQKAKKAEEEKKGFAGKLFGKVKNLFSEEADTTSIKQVKTTVLKADVKEFERISKKTLASLREQEKAMFAQDLDSFETLTTKNQLETLIYETKSKLGDIYLEYADQETRESLMKDLEKVGEWLYGEGAHTTLAEYVDKIQHLNSMINPIAERHKTWELVYTHLGEFMSYLSMYEESLPADGQASEEGANFLNEICEHRNWGLEIQNIKKTGNDHKGVLEELSKRRQETSEKYNQINEKYKQQQNKMNVE